MPYAVALVTLIGAPAAAELPEPGDIVTLAPTQQGIDPSCDIQVGTHLDAVPNFSNLSVALQIELRRVLPDHAELVASAPATGDGLSFVVGAFTIKPGVVVAPGVAVCTRIVTESTAGAAPLSTRLYGYFAKSPAPSISPINR